ncbi:EFR1 family ferrodoxin [uncultured Prevotella sp.]|uniref:EFR1 family ferrodoxin n=1 Tax=uncultured Prevotella sp. TaxID=159272 RepID=UPI00258F31B3|nr:EFR1 family ferrodoxin [uncultured Prevotella sp.]
MIFYFSGTGNTRWAAERVAAATGERLISIADAIGGDCHFDLSSDERIGFIFPIHGWRPPLLILKFIKKLDITADGHYCYALVTAGDSIGKAMDYLSAALLPKGLSIDSCFSLIMPESYVGLPFMDVDTKEREKEKKDKSANDLEEYIKAIVARRKGLSEIVKGPLPGFFSGPVGAFFVRYLITDRPFHVDRERCISCGKCEKVCPVGDVKMVADGSREFPTWIHNGECLTCFACYHHCPKKAIDYGHRTQHKGQYYFKKI